MSGKTIGQLSAATVLDGTELLEIEQSGASKYMTLNNIIGTTVITADYTANNFNETIIVNSASALTITIPADLAIGTIKNILRALTASTAITTARSGAETIEGAASFIVIGAKASAEYDASEVTLRKVASGEWRFVAGEIVGSNTNGRYTKSSNGKLVQILEKNQAISITGAYAAAFYGTFAWTFPVPFYDDYIYVDMKARGVSSGRITPCEIEDETRILTGTNFLILDVYGASFSATFHIKLFASGRWR